ncbi:MAG: hypothetical protein IPH53_09305 [Flavobacteriales bacterium]|nr:hypothetical protein [Flavobacteriales bacterium]
MIQNPPAESMEQVRQAERTLERIGHHIRSADEKIRALFGANTLLAAALTFTRQVQLHTLPTPWGQLAIVGTIVMLLATVCLQPLLAMVALLPRIKSSRTPGISFFGDIASLSPAEFGERFLANQHKEQLPDLLRQVHISAPMRARNTAIWAGGPVLILALGLWFILLVANLLLTS